MRYINRYANVYIIFRYFLASNKVAAHFLSTRICGRGYHAAISQDRDISRFKLPVINSKRGYDSGREGSTGRKEGRLSVTEQ